MLTSGADKIDCESSHGERQIIDSVSDTARDTKSLIQASRVIDRFGKGPGNRRAEHQDSKGRRISCLVATAKNRETDIQEWLNHQRRHNK